MDFLYFLGRFHVLVLHLPIGIICALFVLEWLARKEKYRYLEPASPFLWGAMALTALVTGSIAAAGSSVRGLTSLPVPADTIWLGV